MNIQQIEQRERELFWRLDNLIADMIGLRDAVWDDEHPEPHLQVLNDALSSLKGGHEILRKSLSAESI